MAPYTIRIWCKKRSRRFLRFPRPLWTSIRLRIFLAFQYTLSIPRDCIGTVGRWIIILLRLSQLVFNPSSATKTDQARLLSRATIDSCETRNQAHQRSMEWVSWKDVKIATTYGFLTSLSTQFNLQGHSKQLGFVTRLSWTSLPVVYFRKIDISGIFWLSLDT